MIPPLEAALFRVIDRDEFWAVCRAAFSGQSGITLRRALCSVAHPLFPPVGKDALETYRQIGRAEVVNLLLRFSDAAVSPASLIHNDEQPKIRPKSRQKSRSRSGNSGIAADAETQPVPLDPPNATDESGAGRQDAGSDGMEGEIPT